jgi:hypothetical protein
MDELLPKPYGVQSLGLAIHDGSRPVFAARDAEFGLFQFDALPTLGTALRQTVDYSTGRSAVRASRARTERLEESQASKLPTQPHSHTAMRRVSLNAYNAKIFSRSKPWESANPGHLCPETTIRKNMDC